MEKKITENSNEERPIRVAVAGATGFIGRNVLRELCMQNKTIVRGLTRRSPHQMKDIQEEKAVEWVQADSYSLKEVEAALEEVDVLVYLIHSMLPSATLLQGSFEDLDAYLADSFGQAAARKGLKQIVYLGGIIPDSGELSPHLRSRKEVEVILGSYGIPVTTIRAALIVGEQGSSFRIMERLIRRLPVLLCPAWTLRRCQPIHVTDVVQILVDTIGSSEDLGRAYDVGGPERLTYRQMLEKTAQILTKKRLFIPFPFLSLNLSKLWVNQITGVPQELVYPLVDSLRHEMCADPKRERKLQSMKPKPFTESLQEALSHPSLAQFSFREFLRLGNTFRVHRDVRSIQRLKRTQNWTAEAIMQAYFNWLPTLFSQFIKAVREGGVVRFRLLGFLDLLELTLSPERSSPSRSLLYVTGGLLVRKPVHPKGRLEFREIHGGSEVLCCLQDFRPSLPWPIYVLTQARVHLFVLRRFQRYLDAQKPRKTESSQANRKESR
jgi:uncharacterized protein YbjT (DUF2867 family)